MQNQMQGGMGGGGGFFGIGQSKAKRFDKSTSNESYDDVAGLENSKKELQEVVDYLREPKKYERLGASMPRGLLLVGPPGTGKTLLARATAGEAGVPFFSISGSEFIEMFVGVGASRVRDMFKTAKKEAPSIIFIDELDSIGRARGTGLGGGHDEREQTLNQILAEMDGFSSHESVVVMAATNRPDVLDAALTRPGRFDRRITLDMPWKKAREKILAIHSKDVPLHKDVNLKEIAAMTVGLSGADLQNLVNEAALMAGRHDRERVAKEDFYQARDKIMMGTRREERITDEDREIIAYHEAGHTLVASMIPEADPLQKVSIIPRGKALGATEQIPEQDRYNLSREYLLGRIAVMLGGRSAEKLIFKDVTTGAANDLQQATRTARHMVTRFGMSERLGAATFTMDEEHVFLGKDISKPKHFSEHTNQVIDQEIQSIIDEREQTAYEILSKNRKRLEKLAEELLDRESLEVNEIEEIIKTSSGKKKSSKKSK
jgi:cell division protease FtsH